MQTHRRSQCSVRFVLAGPSLRCLIGGGKKKRRGGGIEERSCRTATRDLSSSSGAVCPLLYVGWRWGTTGPIEEEGPISTGLPSLFSMCSQLINASRLPTRHLPPRIASQLRLCVVVLPCGANHITVARITPCSLATISHSMSPPLLGSYYLYLEPTLSASDPLPAGLPSSYSILFPHKSYVSNFSF
jgi:hypothetical protein